MFPVSTPGAVAAQKRRARQGLTIFFLLVIPLSALCQFWVVMGTNMLSGFLLMWVPGAAALIARLILREGIQDVSFRLGGLWVGRALCFALLIPALVGLLAYGLAWTTGLAVLVPFHASVSLTVFLSFFHVYAALPRILLSLLFLTLISAISVSGEEIGWRGYMLTRLIDAGLPAPIMVSGLIWSLWHWPLLLLDAHEPIVWALLWAIIFLITITALGYVSAYLRLATGSIWPSIVLHAAWNSIILDILDAFSSNTTILHWTGESGILVALLMVIVAYVACSIMFRMPRTGNIIEQT
jgi:membrane protease YdiL (CAAX protease family)